MVLVSIWRVQRQKFAGDGEAVEDVSRELPKVTEFPATNLLPMDIKCLITFSKKNKTKKSQVAI